MNDRIKLFIGLALILGTGVWGYLQYQIYQGNLEKIDDQNQNIANLTSELSDLSSKNDELRVDLQSARDDTNSDYEQILPQEQDLTDLTRLFDDFATRNNFSNSPAFISNLNYQKPVALENENLSYIPLTLTLSASKENTEKFLNFIEESGSLESGTRLMSVQDVSISYPDEVGGLYVSKLTIFAYFTPELE